MADNSDPTPPDGNGPDQPEGATLPPPVGTPTELESGNGAFTKAAKDAGKNTAKKTAKKATSQGAKQAGQATAKTTASKTAQGVSGKAASLGKKASSKANVAGEVASTAKSLTKPGEDKDLKTDAKDAVKDTATGAVQGASVGGAAGALVGGLKGLGQAALKSKRGRKILLTIMAIAMLPSLMMLTAYGSATAVIAGAILGQEPQDEPGDEGQDPGSQCLLSTDGGQGVVIPDEYADAVESAARTAGVPKDVIAAQIQAESNWNPNAQSGAGARGIAQFMPGTWAKYGNGADPFDPIAGIDAMGRYMQALMGMTEGMAGGDDTRNIKLALASYNAGFGNVSKYDGIPPFEETQGYVKKIMRLAGQVTEAECGPQVPGNIELGPGQWSPIVPGGRLTSDYGPRGCPFASCTGRPFLLHHDGIDIAGGSDWFFAPTKMKITRVGGPGDPLYPFYGNYIYAVQTEAPHLMFEFHEATDGSIAVSEGDVVEAGTPLGKQGATGNSSGVHVHFQIDKPGTNATKPETHIGETLDPIPILQKKGVAP